jgi:adenine-specific DNA-methyltransferase
VGKSKLELVWVGKEERTRLEPRVLVEDSALSYGDPRSENMLIHGDNLLALKALEQDFAGRIKCIYIDPPYNTGYAFQHYDDGLEHSIWLTMMRDRLEILRNLLASNGSLWISIDDNECHYLKVLCDEVFGRQNFVSHVIWQKIFSPKSTARHLSDMHDHILLYAREKELWKRNLLPRSEKHDASYKNPDDDPRGPWTSGDLSARNYYSVGTYPISTRTGRVIPGPPKGMYWRVSKEKFGEMDRDNRIWWGKTGNNQPRIKRFLSEVMQGIVPQTIWFHNEVGNTQEAKKEVMAVVPDDADVFQTPKPERLIQRILSISTEPGDWVLDSFAGTGTTGAVAQKIGRRWLMVELGAHCFSHILPRLRSVVDGTDEGGVSPVVNWQGGGGFKLYRLAESLLVKDKQLSTPKKPVYIINPKYDATMLIRAICKIENFRYRKNDRWHGASSEHHFLYVTTKLLTQQHLDALGADLGDEDTMLMYCTRRVRGLKIPDNIEVKKIPRDLLAKCAFEEGK